MDKLKDIFGPAGVREIANAVKRACPEFPAKKFSDELARPLAKLELKGRVHAIAAALGKYLPQDLATAYKILASSVASEENPRGVDGFLAWPLTEFVAMHGKDELNLSLATLKKLTKVMSAEFAIRVFLLRYPEAALKILAKWTKDENVHVRRLASEGSRPRLPWGQRLPHFQKDPELCLPLLRQLKKDPELYVRKSVANHLNDFSKDHPDWLVKTLKAWRAEDPEGKELTWIIRHSTRSLVKQGHQGALSLLGLKSVVVKNPKLALSAKKVKFGSALTFTFSASGAGAENWLIDYAIHHRKNNGEMKPKVFKWTKKEVSPQRPLEVSRSHKFVHISTRKYYPGKHSLEIFVNGQSVARQDFELVMGK